MDAKSILRAAQKFTIDNSPAILTGIGVAGTITTAILAGRASYSSVILLENALVEKRQTDRGMLTTQEKVAVVYKEFIPAAVVGAVTILAIIGANHVSSRRTAALAAAFKISEEMAQEYREKVREKMGAKGEEMMRSEIAKERMERVDTSKLIVDGSQVAFWDPWAGRAFVSTKELVQQAVNQINNQIQYNYCASLSDFYDILNLPRTAISDQFGWNNDELLEPYFTGTLLSDGNPAIEMRFEIQPFVNFNRIGIG